MSHPPVSCIPNTGKMSKAKKVIEEAKEINNPEIDLVDKGLTSLEEIPGLCKFPALKQFLPYLEPVFIPVNVARIICNKTDL